MVLGDLPGDGGKRGTEPPFWAAAELEALDQLVAARVVIDLALAGHYDLVRAIRFAHSRTVNAVCWLAVIEEHTA